MAVRSSAESDASISSEKAWAAGAAPLLPFLEPPGRAGIFFFLPALPPPPGSGGGIVERRGAPEVERGLGASRLVEPNVAVERHGVGGLVGVFVATSWEEATPGCVRPGRNPVPRTARYE
eukprot:COSAG04_NODE_1201_length_7768_cov_3.753944_2_plen_120_part_00